jgi:NAD(P)H-nitrite reductase large subunit
MNEKELLSHIDQVGELLSQLPAAQLGDDVLICECFCVSVRDIREACQYKQRVDLELLAKNLSLGHGCQSCLQSADSWQNLIF